MCLSPSYFVQNSFFFCLTLQTGVSYHIILMYYLNYEHTGLLCQRFYCYLPTAANEPMSRTFTENGFLQHWNIRIVKWKMWSMLLC